MFDILPLRKIKHIFKLTTNKFSISAESFLSDKRDTHNIQQNNY